MAFSSDPVEPALTSVEVCDPAPWGSWDATDARLLVTLPYPAQYVRWVRDHPAPPLLCHAVTELVPHNSAVISTAGAAPCAAAAFRVRSFAWPKPLQRLGRRSRLALHSVAEAQCRQFSPHCTAPWGRWPSGPRLGQLCGRGLGQHCCCCGTAPTQGCAAPQTPGLWSHPGGC